MRRKLSGVLLGFRPPEQRDGAPVGGPVLGTRSCPCGQRGSFPSRDGDAPSALPRLSPRAPAAIPCSAGQTHGTGVMATAQSTEAR